MIGLTMASACLFNPYRQVEVDESKAAAPVVLFDCTEASLTAAVRSSPALDASLRPSAAVLRPVCDGAFGYARIAAAGADAEGLEVIFRHGDGGWVVADLGTGLDCRAPAPPLTPQACAALQQRWR